jgi:hypothetical protein
MAPVEVLARNHPLTTPAFPINHGVTISDYLEIIGVINRFFS